MQPGKFLRRPPRRQQQIFFGPKTVEVLVGHRVRSEEGAVVIVIIFSSIKRRSRTSLMFHLASRTESTSTFRRRSRRRVGIIHDGPAQEASRSTPRAGSSGVQKREMLSATTTPPFHTTWNTFLFSSIHFDEFIPTA